ncbi:MAG: transposase [Thomasclavelia ramosa]|uniref:transposase n=1 Tax=Thomasclavelia sp. TaxID=3025757 RepID=UPI00257E4F7F|nr:transposase [Thomasclavelia sp.]
MNYNLNELQSKVNENLRTADGIEKKKQRSIQAEGTFGVIKQDMNYTRLRRKGSLNVKTEFFLIGIAYKFKKIS